jgi:hypothetical protein
VATETTFYTRVGAAAQAGAPIGSSVDIARTVPTNRAAQSAGRAIAQSGQSFFQPGATLNANREVVREEEAPSFWDRVGGVVSGVGRPVLRALEWGTEATGNIAETNLRTIYGRVSQGDVGGTLKSLLLSPLADDEWRDNWDRVVKAQASIGQTAWLVAEDAADSLGLWDAGTSGSGMEDEQGNIVGPRVRSRGLDLLDDPTRRAERQEYFSEGMAHWTTGVGDALWQVFADPLIVAGAGAGAARRAASTLKADDVARVADRSLDAAELTNKQARSRDLVRQFAEAFEDAGAGTVSNAARTRYLKNSTDGGAIAYFMGRAGEYADDAASRIELREDIIYAGMGDKAALERVGQRAELLRVELDKMNAPLRDLPDGDELVRAVDATDDDLMRLASESVAKATDSPVISRELKAQESLIRKDLEALSRITEVGRPVAGVDSGVGGLANIPATRAGARRDVARITKTRQYGQFLEPVQYVTGRHLPGTFKLSDDDAGNVFHEAVLRARRVATGLAGDQREAFTAALKGLEDEFLAAGIGAQSKAARGTIVARFDSLVDEVIAAKYGVDKDALGAVHSAVRGRRKATIQAVATRAYQARSANQVEALHAGDGVFAIAPDAKWVEDLGRPVARSQIEDFVSIIDPRLLDRFAQNHFKDGMSGFAKMRANVDPRRLHGTRAWEVTEHALSVMNRAWKFGALLRPFAYFVRAQMDTQARNLAMLTPLKYMADAGRSGFVNLPANLRKMDKGEALALSQRFFAHQRIDEIEDALARGIDDEALAKELADLKEAVAKPVTFKRTGEKVRVRDTEAARIRGKSARIDRQGNYTAPRARDAYRSTDEFKRVVASFDAEDSILGLLTGSTRGQLDSMRRSGRWDLIRGSDASWDTAYIRAVNNQIRSDALGQRLLAGQTDEEILAWFKNDPEGIKYLRDMRATGAESGAVVVARFRDHIDTLLPEGSAARSVALERSITAKEIKEMWPVPSDRPHVPGEILDENWTRPVAAAYESIERRYFQWVAQIPENMMGRHPLYAGRFEVHAKKLIEQTGLDEATMTLGQINDVRRAADRFARRDIGRYMFDTSKQTNIGHMLRFVSPFYGAWEDTMVKWARIFGQHPEMLALGWKVARSPNAAGLVVDEDGNQIDPLGNVRDRNTGEVIGQKGMWDGYVVLPIPGPLQKWTGAKDVRIAKNAANVIFQGDPWFLPGPGPMLAVPANEIIVNSFPEVWGEEGSENPILKWILPYGPTSDSVAEQVMPSWAKAAKDALTQDSRRVDQVFTQLYIEQVNAERNGESDPMSDDDRMDLIANRTRNWTLLRLFGTQMPFTFTPQSRLGFYKSEWDRYRREFGADAEERFAQDYPEYFDMAISLSESETGLRATDESWGAIQAYRNDMAKHPEYGWFWAGAANLADGWSQGVYHAQLRQEVGPGTSTHFRRRKDPLEAAREAMVSQGWREYQQISTALDLKLEERGLTSLRQTGAEDLAAIREEFVQELSVRNQDWAAAYREGGNPGKVTEFLTLAIDQFNSHPELMSRGDGAALAQYLEIRNAIKSKMAERGLSSINAQGNADLLEIWEQATAELRQDVGFDQMWTRVLSRDDLSGETYAKEAG